jgi:hypothetical protein
VKRSQCKKAQLCKFHQSSSHHAHCCFVQDEVIIRKDAKAATIKEKLLKANQKKKCVKTAKNDDTVVWSAIQAFNRSTIVKLTTNLQDALGEKSKFLDVDAQLNTSVQKRVVAKKALEEGKIMTKTLQNQLSYFRKRLAFLAEQRNVVVTKLSDTTTSAKKPAKLFELLSTGLMVSSGGLFKLESMHMDFVRNLFKPWKLIYASL